MRPVIERNHALAPLTSLGVGGPARFFCRAEDEGDVARAISWAREHDVRWMVMGGGSNLVVSDDGFDGLVMLLDSRGIEACASAGTARVTVAAGEPWDAFVGHCVQRGWAGIECLSGIPGRVGATPIQNVGAYGQEVARTIESVTVFDSAEGKTLVFEADECAFRYRDSRFKSAEPHRYVVTAVTFQLDIDGPPALHYDELAGSLREFGIANPTLPQVRHAVVALRRRKSMVLDPSDPNTHSVGSFFTNPVVDADTIASVCQAGRRLGVLASDDDLPRHPSGEQFKLSAAWLIERAGFPKGYRRGPAGLSENHCLAIVNRDRASARDIVALAREIRDAVRDRFGVTLTPEPRFIGMPPFDDAEITH